MSRKIRIGKDITLRWRVLTDFESKPLSGRNLLLYLTDPLGLVIPLDFAVTNNNLISATYPGKDQVKLGRYILTLAENKGLDGSTAVDIIDAFTLVARTAYEGGDSGCHNLTLETIDLEGNLVTGGRGMSAYEVWLSQGHVGSEADFLLSLIGKDGISIVKIEQIETSSESSGVNRIIVTLSNGTSEDFIVRNGAKGDKMTYEDLTEADKEDIYAGGAEMLKPLFATKQNKLTAGKGISIDGDVISCTLDIDIFRVVDALPSVGEANLIYFVPAEQPSESDLFEEWVWTDKWERIGSAKIDLSNYATKMELATKANLQHQHTVADITDFPELYYDATAFFTSGAYPSDKYGELLEAVKAKKTVYATLDEEGDISYVFFTSLANSDASSSRVLLTTIFVDGSYLYLNTFVLQQSGMTRLQENITGKADKATTLAGYGIGDAYTKSEVNAALEGKQDTLTPGNGISIEGNVISSTTDSLITPITYAELVALRDSSSLVAGMQYRITDYDFTTTEEDTDSAHMLFDIIVTADSESVLNENARAIHHQYESNKETVTGAIKLYKTDMSNEEYSSKVDNQDYFLLAGKIYFDGVIYYRYDKYEFVNNDYVNAGRYILLEAIDLDSLGIGLDNPLYPVGGGAYEEDGTYISHSDDAIVDYENGTVTVDSILPLSNRDIASWKLKYTLENTKHSSPDGKGTILWMKDEYRNECNYDFINALFKVYEITACAKSPSLVGTYAIKTINTPITYGTNSKLISTFGGNNHDNIIKYDGLAKIVLGNDCFSNTFGNDCFSNTFGNDCDSNTFGNNCDSNTFGNNCDSNTFGDDCFSNTFGNNCDSNTFGNNCDSNTFGNNCFSNTFGGACSFNTFGNDCNFNTFGDACYYIKFATTSSATTKYNYYRQNYFGDGCQYILFKGAETASSSAQVQNYNFAQGLQGTSSAYLTIDGVRSRAYETKVAKNSSGELKIYCEADLIQ